MKGEREEEVFRNCTSEYPNFGSQKQKEEPVKNDW